MDKILFEQIPDLFTSVGNLFIEKKEELCEMDARLGDGDLGLTMSKGYGSLPDIMRTEAEGAAGDIGKLLMKSGMKMSSLVPSTMGFLMSTGIMEGGKALKGKNEIDASGLAAYLQPVYRNEANVSQVSARSMIPFSPQHRLRKKPQKKAALYKMLSPRH